MVRDGGVHQRQTEAGVEYHFGAARNPSFAIGLTAFVLIWTGALWLQIAIDAPVLFPLLTGLIELLLLVIAADLWLGTTTVTVGPHTVRWRRAIAGLGTTRVIASTDIVKIDLHISRRRAAATGRPITRSGQRRGLVSHRSLGSGIRNKAHAEWFAQEMRSAIGLRS
jgi:hypothetical protein